MTSSLCLSESVYKICQRQHTELKLGKLIVHSKFHKICKFENHVTRMRHDITRNNGKMRTSAKPNKLYIIRRLLMRAIQKIVLSIKFEPICQKLWAFMSNFGIFYDARSPNMGMSRDPRSNF